VPQRPHIVHQVLHADRYIEGDVPATLRAAAGLAPAKAAPDRRAEIASAHAALAEDWGKAEAKAEGAARIEPVSLCVALRETLPKDTLIFDETITHARLVQTHVRPETEGSYTYVQGGLGQGLGVALGAKLGAPGNFVVLTVGDGAFLYNPIVQSLAAARDMGLAVLIVIFNNRKYLSMKYNHLRFYPDGQSVEHDLFQGVDLDTQPELHALAGPCGAVGIGVSGKPELRAALEQAIATVQAGRTVVLNVAVTR
jgi:acetolactate synthase-1/2/3 large subunit